jgi:hypothetical protein
MRRFIIALSFCALALAGGVGPAAAGAWCAYYEDSGGTDCGFATWQECEADISGNGGYCAANPGG